MKSAEMCQCAFEINPQKPHQCFFLQDSLEKLNVCLQYREKHVDLTVLLSHTHTFTTFPKTTTMGCTIQITILSALLLRPQMFVRIGAKKKKKNLWRLGNIIKCSNYQPASDYHMLFQRPGTDSCSEKSNVLKSFSNTLN